MRRAIMSDLKDRQAALDVWVDGHWATLSPLGYLLALAMTFGAATLAAYLAGFGVIYAAICGVIFIVYIRMYVRAIPTVQRLIERLHPEPENTARPDTPPGWAVFVHILIGVALFLIVGTLDEGPSHAAMALFAAFAASTNLLHLFWRRRDGTRAFDTFDEQLDAWAAQYRGTLRTLGTTWCFALLPGGVALHAYESGFAQWMAATCAPCTALPNATYLVAAACGIAAILFVAFYAWLTSSVQRFTTDPWKFVRPEPQSTKVPRWVRALHAEIGRAHV